MTGISASAVNTLTLLSWAAYRQDGDATAGENDLAAGLAGSGWTIVRPSQLGLSTLDPDNEYFEVRIGSSSGPVAAAFLVQRDGVLAIAFRGSDEPGDLLATISNQSGYFNAYRNFLDAALLYAADPANGVTQIFVTGHSLGGVMAEWFSNDYALEVSALELPISIATFGSPGTDIASPPTELAQSIVHFGHTGDQIFEHTGLVGGFLTGLVREGTSIEIDLPNVDANDPRLNFFEHDIFLYQHSAPALANSYFGQQLMDGPTSHQIIVDTVIAAQDDQVALNFSTSSVPLAIIGDSGIITPGFADIDNIWGGSAGDWIDGGRGNDTLLGGAGNDTMIGGMDADILNGGDGSDTASYATAGAGITARLDLAFGLDGGGAFDTYTSIENVTGSDFADVIVGKGGEANTLSGGSGDDQFIGEGIDTINGGAGSDVFFGGQGSALNINLATASVETVWGSFVGDVMNGSTATANLTMVGQGLTGGANADTMTGGSGDDFIYFRAGDVIGGGAGSDWAVATLSASGVTLNMTTTEFENAWGSTSNDSFTAAGSATTAVIVGDAGNDILTGGNAGDFLYGFGDDDNLTGNGGNDNLIGGAGTDTFAFSPGWGTDIVWDWVDGSEQFNLQSSGATSFGNLTIDQNYFGSGNAYITFGTNHILVVGGANHISAGDFLF